MNDIMPQRGGTNVLTSLIAAGHAVTYTPDPVWDGWFADVRDGDRLIECGLGATQEQAAADLSRRLEQRGGLAGLLAAVLAEGLSARFALAEEDGACFADLVSATGSQSSGVARTPLGALQAAAAEFGIDAGDDEGDQADEDEDDNEAYCSACGGKLGIFLGHGDGWHHFRGNGMPESPNELYDAGHEPVAAWRAAGGGDEEAETLEQVRADRTFALRALADACAVIRADREAAKAEQS